MKRLLTTIRDYTIQYPRRLVSLVTEMEAAYFSGTCIFLQAHSITAQKTDIVTNITVASTCKHVYLMENSKRPAVPNILNSQTGKAGGLTAVWYKFQ